MTRSRFALAVSALLLLAPCSLAFVPRAAPRLVATSPTTISGRSAKVDPVFASFTAGDVPQDEEDSSKKKVSIFPCGDELDKRLMKIAIPMTITFLVTPLMGAIDLFWVNRMGNALAVAGQAASNQVYNTAFWLASFLPSGKLDLGERYQLLLVRY